MALGNSDITTAAVNTELGSPYGSLADVKQDVLITHANAGNIASFYGTGTLVVDASKNVSWVAPSSNYKFGDFRSYDASAVMPAASNNFTHYWGPGGATTNLPMVSLPQVFNILFVDSGALYIVYNAYLSSGTPGRAAETSLYDSQISAWLYSTITALSGHTRTQTQRIQHPHVLAFNPFDVSGLSSPTDYVYMDTFFGSAGGGRLVNMGDAIANGYTTITMQESQSPEIDASGTIVSSPPSGYTAIFPVIAASSSPCLDDGPISGGSIGTTNITFYIGFHGIYGPNLRSVGASAATIRITYDGSTKDVSLGSVSSGSKDYVSTTLPGSKTWQYNKDAVITCVSDTFASTPPYTSCP